MGYKGGKLLFARIIITSFRKEIGEPNGWVILAYLPIVGPIMMTVFHLFLMKNLEELQRWNKFLLRFCPFYLFILRLIFKLE